MGHPPLSLRQPHPFCRGAPKSGSWGERLHAPEATGAAYLAASIRREAPAAEAKRRYAPSRNHYVRGFCRRDLLGASIAERFSVDDCEKVLPLAQQNRRNGEVHLVD